MQPRVKHALNEPRNIIWIGLTIISVTLFVAVVQVALSIRDLQGQLTSLEQIVPPNGGGPSIGRLRSSLASARTDMAVIRADTGWLLPLLPALGWLPQFGGDLSQADAIFNMSDSLLSGADSVFNVWSPTLDALSSQQSGEVPSAIDPSTASARGSLLLARAYLARADVQRARIQPERLSARTAAILDRVDRAVPLLQLAVEGSLALPDLLGTDGPRTYLLVAQNEDERRATGGFVSAAGIVTVEGGRVSQVEFLDSYMVDDPDADFPAPPEPIQTYMLGGYWLFRDANWSPDFPTSARQLAAFYELGQHRHVDGVIAVDQEMVRLLVQAAGSIDVLSTPPVQVTADNLLTYMRESWAPPLNADVSSKWLARKNFIGELARAMQSRVLNRENLSAVDLAKAVYSGLRGRHLLVYLPDSPLARALARPGWDGALQSHPGDFVMVVDSNVGFNKSNALVAQEYDYSLTIAPDGSVQAALQIGYQHTGASSGRPCQQKVPEYSPTTIYADLMNLCFWDYLRLYVPAGSTLVDATRFPIPAQLMLNRTDSSGESQVAPAEGSKDTFSAIFVVAEGEHKDFLFRYKLPSGTIQQAKDGTWSYSLYWQKQPGTASIPLRVALSLPPGAVVLRSVPVPAAQSASENNPSATQLNYVLDVSTDVTLQVIYRR